MDSFGKQIDVGKFILAKQLLEGSLGILKIVDPIRQTSTKCSAVLINESTVLTLAKYVYNNSTASFFSQILFTIGINTEVYHVVESYLINSPNITQNNEGLINYAIHKLDKTVDQSSSLFSRLASQSVLNQKSQIQEKKQFLKEQLNKAKLSISELKKTVNDMNKLLQIAVSQLYEAASNYIQRDAFRHANQIYNLCLKIEQKLYGQESLETIGVRERIAYICQWQSSSTSIQHYKKILQICQKYSAQADSNYVNAHFKLGSLFHKKDLNNEAICHLEEALHIYAENGDQEERECARLLMNVLYESNSRECAEKIKQKYKF